MKKRCYTKLFINLSICIAVAIAICIFANCANKWYIGYVIEELGYEKLGYYDELLIKFVTYGRNTILFVEALLVIYQLWSVFRYRTLEVHDNCVVLTTLFGKVIQLNFYQCISWCQLCGNGGLKISTRDGRKYVFYLLADGEETEKEIRNAMRRYGSN